jgi:hypothetical protein
MQSPTDRLWQVNHITPVGSKIMTSFPWRLCASPNKDISGREKYLSLISELIVMCDECASEIRTAA